VDSRGAVPGGNQPSHASLWHRSRRPAEKQGSLSVCDRGCSRVDFHSADVKSGIFLRDPCRDGLVRAARGKRVHVRLREYRRRIACPRPFFFFRRIARNPSATSPHQAPAACSRLLRSSWCQRCGPVHMHSERSSTGDSNRENNSGAFTPVVHSHGQSLKPPENPPGYSALRFEPTRATASPLRPEERDTSS
jgi:hypothetical protein